MFDGILNSTTDFLTYYTSHRTPDESEIHTAYDYRFAFRVTYGGANGIFKIRFLGGFFQSLGVGFRIYEIQRVFRSHFGIEFLKFVVIKQYLEILFAAYAHVITIIRTYIKVGSQLILFHDVTTR